MERIIYVGSIMSFGNQSNKVTHRDFSMCNVSNMNAFLDVAQFHVSQQNDYLEYSHYSIQASKVLIHSDGTMDSLERKSKQWQSKDFQATK